MSTFLGSWCPQCGSNVSVDEDGCCISCGCCAVGQGADEAFATIADLRDRLAKTEAVVEAAREDAQHCPHACSPPCPFDRAVARTRSALRALDSPVGAGTDSGSEGSPSNSSDTGGTQGKAPAAAGLAGSSPAPSSAGSSRDPQAPATRADVEALMRRVERLEGLTGSGSGSGSG